MYNVIGLNRKDVVYTMLPMYHMSANGIATGPVIAYGIRTIQASQAQNLIFFLKV